MLCQRIRLVALVMSLSITTSVGKPRSFVLDVQLKQQQGPTCLVAAAVIAVSARGIKLDMHTFIRETPVFRDGIHPYDLAVTASKLGLSSLIFTGPPEAAARLVRAGFAPMALLNSGTGRHAVAVTGVRHAAVLTDGLTTMTEYRLADPAQHTHNWVSARDFERQQSGQQMIVLFKKSEMIDLSSSGFPTKIATKMDAQFRAETLYRRALKHSTPNAQMKSLLEKALEWQPCHGAARAKWDRLQVQLEPRATPMVKCKVAH
jgi:hypothetical protein